jgi:hypothetical protein
MRLRRDARRVARDEAPQHRAVVRVGGADQVEQQGEGDRQLDRRRVAVVDVPDRIAEPLLPVLPRIGRQE